MRILSILLIKTTFYSIHIIYFNVKYYLHLLYNKMLYLCEDRNDKIYLFNILNTICSMVKYIICFIRYIMGYLSRCAVILPILIPIILYNIYFFYIKFITSDYFHILKFISHIYYTYFVLCKKYKNFIIWHNILLLWYISCYSENLCFQLFYCDNNNWKLNLIIIRSNIIYYVITYHYYYDYY